MTLNGIKKRVLSHSRRKPILPGLNSVGLGLDKESLPVTVRRGIADLLEKVEEGILLVV